MSDERTDEELFQDVAGGDMNAFRDLVGRYDQRIVGFLSRFLNDHDRAMDLAQETFLRLYSRLRDRAPDSAGQGRASSLIFTIAANLGRDELRRRRVRGEVPLGEREGLIPGAITTPGAVALRRETQQDVREVLAGLDEETRELLLLREVEGLSYQEIAAILCVPLGTVKSRINRARLAFKDAYFQHSRASTSSRREKKEPSR